MTKPHPARDAVSIWVDQGAVVGVVELVAEVVAVVAAVGAAVVAGVDAAAGVALPANMVGPGIEPFGCATVVCCALTEGGTV